jgi:hypothetical protein
LERKVRGVLLLAELGLEGCMGLVPIPRDIGCKCRVGYMRVFET